MCSLGLCLFAGLVQANYYQSLNQIEVDSSLDWPFDAPSWRRDERALLETKALAPKASFSRWGTSEGGRVCLGGPLEPGPGAKAAMLDIIEDLARNVGAGRLFYALKPW